MIIYHRDIFQLLFLSGFLFFHNSTQYSNNLASLHVNKPKSTLISNNSDTEIAPRIAVAIMTHCWYRDCPQVRTFGHKYTFFSLPKNPIQRAAWTLRCGYKPHTDDTKKSAICELHFEASDIRRQFYRSTLRPGALPIQWVDVDGGASRSSIEYFDVEHVVESAHRDVDDSGGGDGYEADNGSVELQEVELIDDDEQYLDDEEPVDDKHHALPPSVEVEEADDYHKEFVIHSKCDTTTSPSQADDEITSQDEIVEEHRTHIPGEKSAPPAPTPIPSRAAAEPLSDFPVDLAIQRRNRKRKLIAIRNQQKKRKAAAPSPSSPSAASLRTKTPPPPENAAPVAIANAIGENPEDMYFALSLVGSLQRLKPHQRAMAKMNIVRYLTEMAFTEKATI